MDMGSRPKKEILQWFRKSPAFGPDRYRGNSELGFPTAWRGVTQCFQGIQSNITYITSITLPSFTKNGIFSEFYHDFPLKSTENDEFE